MAELQQQLSTSSNSEDANDHTLGGSSSSTSSSSSGTSEQALTLQLVVGELREELQRQSDATRSEMLGRQRAEGLLKESSTLLAREKESNNKLRLELMDRPSKDEFADFKRQLRVLRRIAFNVQDEDENSDVDADDEDDEGIAMEQDYDKDQGKVVTVFTTNLRTAVV